MSFNSDALILLPLGISGDVNTEPGPPALPDGNHLRWAPDQGVGFPWYGFYLFRRESRPSRPRCLAPELERFRPGTSRSLDLATRLGRLSSARPLVLTDAFPPQGLVEIDLGQGAPLRFDLPAGVEAGRVQVSIGLRAAGPRTVRTCADFRGLPLGLGPSPRTEQGAVFTTKAPPVSPFVAVTSIEQRPGGPAGLQTTLRLEIALPCPANRVDLLLTNSGELRLEALSAAGASLAVKTLDARALNAGTVTLTGATIARVTIVSSTVDPALLHQVCWECPDGSPGPSKGPPAIEVHALAGTAVVASAAVQGDAGKVVAASFEGAGITAVEIAAGQAALVDLCIWPAKQGATFGWDPVPGFIYPLCLPVAEDGYPCPGKPATVADAQALAFSRVTYHAPPGWDSDFPGLHAELVTLVKGGPGAGPMAGRERDSQVGTSLSPASFSQPPTLSQLRSLDLLYLASLQPAVAQMLGLYFADTSVAPGVAYDYLLLADPTGVLGGSADSALTWLAFTPDPAAIDAVLVPNLSTQTHPAIPPPGDPHAYVLPGAATRAVDGVLRAATSSVGLWWPLPPDATEPRPDQPIFYYPRRALLGPSAPLVRPPATAYHPLQPADTPVLVSEPAASAQIGPRSSDWPPSQDAPATATTLARQAIPLHLVDGNLADGWYSYRIVVQDLFGRRSALGPEARWFEWEQPPEHERHPYAVALLDKLPPPIPLGVEASVLDPLDRWVLVDGPYTTWRTAQPNLVGLRVGWRWTLMQQLQAPDTREFRIYYQPGRWNALLGRTLAVAASTGANAAVESEVALDLADSHAADVFAGARLRLGNDDFAILGSQAGAQLRLRVKNIGVHEEIRPAVGKPCTVAIPEGHALWMDPGLAQTWARRLAYAPYEPPARIVVDPSKDDKGQVLTDAAFQEAHLSTTMTVAGKVVHLPPAAALAGVQPWIDHLWIEDATHATETRRILEFDSQAGTVTVETAFTIGPPVHWILGRPVREYELFLPAPDMGTGNAFEPSLAEPAVYAQIAVSAADDKTYILDDSRWNSGTDHFGNESRLSPSATVFRVLQTPPQAPELKDLSERRYATPADYHGRSYSTFRFGPVEHLKVHVLRAVEDSLFQRDWRIRETRNALNPLDPPAPTSPSQSKPPPNPHLDYFPDGWNVTRRQPAAVALNDIKNPADYANLAKDAWTVLARLPGNEGAAGTADPLQFPIPSLGDRDWLLRRTRNALAATDSDLFPASWNATQKGNAAAALNAIAGPGSYAALSDNALRILAGLPGNEAAFTQVTLAPLKMTDPAIKDERRPDDDASYTPPTSGVRAHTDTLPGHATNRYFYRARFVDGAQNQSLLSLAGPPVYLRNVEPPRAPVITKVLGGERQIELRWVKSPEAEVSAYRVYRVDDEARAGNIRTMERVQELPAASFAPSAIELSWTDRAATAGTDFHYRVTALDSEKSPDESSPSQIVMGRAVDTTPLKTPEWVSAEWVIYDAGTTSMLPWPPSGVIPPPYKAAVRLELKTAADFCSIYRRLDNSSVWQVVALSVTPIAAGEVVLFDLSAVASSKMSYRAVASNRLGATSQYTPATVVEPK